MDTAVFERVGFQEAETEQEPGWSSKQMAKAVFHHKPGSGYDDRPDSFYHFPSQYLARVENCLSDGIIYYGPRPGLSGRFYWAAAYVSRIRKDALRNDRYYADISDYIDFDQPVHYLQDGGFEKTRIGLDGRFSGGHAINAVRPITDEEYAAIVEAGLSSAEEWPDRNDPTGYENTFDGFADPASIISRPVIEQLVNRPFREAKFRQHIRRHYDRTCSFSGLRLINGRGRPEVEAAHIIPVEYGGTDSIQNGLALSATMHWMFDRGLLSLADDLTILTSRHLNHDLSNILNKDMRAIVPKDRHFQPHPDCLKWHRDNRFKS